MRTGWKFFEKLINVHVLLLGTPEYLQSRKDIDVPDVDLS